MVTQGTLNKIRIDAYDNPEYNGKPIDTFFAYVNPTELTVAYEFEYTAQQGQGTSAGKMEFSRAKPADMSINFFLDGTNANKVKIDVQEEIEHFKKVTGYNGDIHRVNYLLLAWGELEVRRCVLKGASINYKLFTPNGVPMRAVITANFTESVDDQTRVAEAQDQSPDLTHVRVVNGGDTLPALCYQIYGDPSYYLEVARANRIDNFRNISPGTRIFFPPLEK